MSTERPPAITDADVRSLAAKLKGLHALSTPAEQELLRIVLGRAAQREEIGIRDTAGFVWAVSFNPFVYLDAIELDALEEQGVRPHRAARRTKRRRTTTSGTEKETTMTQITQDQRDHWEAVAERAAAKLQSFYETLPSDEQLVLDVSLHELLGNQEAVEVKGHAMAAIPWYYRVIATVATRFLPEMIEAYAEAAERLPGVHNKPY